MYTACLCDCLSKIYVTIANVAFTYLQALDKINTESPLDQEKNLQTKFYKKLWIDAEIASCAIKYELQLLRMNAEIENHKYKSKGEISETEESTLIQVESQTY